LLLTSLGSAHYILRDMRTFSDIRKTSRRGFDAIHPLCCGFYIVIALTICCFGGRSLSAQSFQAQVTGVVKDPAGAIVPGAEVHAIDQQKGTDTVATTDQSGAFLFPSLLPSAYTITCDVKGYKQYRQVGIVLEVEQKLQLDVVLAVGGVQETVTVNAVTNGLESSDASIGQVVTGQEIDELPLDVRDPFGLVALMPGVVLGSSFGNGGGGDVGRNFFKSNFNVGGGKSGSQAIMIDGAPDTTADVSRAIINPPVDAIQEFKIQATSYDARFGRTSGAVINMLTKSGSNTVHGALYDYEQNSAFDAPYYFTTGDLPSYSRRQAGGVVGFPILHDRWFAFLDAEVLRQAIPDPQLATVPTAAQRQGDFSSTYYVGGTVTTPTLVTISDPSTYSAATGKRTQFMGCDGAHPNVICLAKLSPAINKLAATLLSYYPLPVPTSSTNSVTNANNFIYTANQITDSYKYDIRNDFNLSKKTTLFGRFSRQHDDRFIPGTLPPANAGTVTADTYTQVVIGLSHVVSPNVLASVTTSFSRALALQSGGLPPVDLAALGFSADFASQAAPQVPILSTSDITGLTRKSNIGNQHQPRNTYATLAQLSYLHGKHSLNFGGEWWILDFNEYQNSNAAGTLKFDHSFTQQSPTTTTGTSKIRGADVADLLLGIPSGINPLSGTAGSSITTVQGISTRGLYYAAYVQDDYRVSDKLTLNLGMRWDVNIGDREKYNRLAWFDPNAPSPLGPSIGNPALKGVVRWVGNGNDIDQQQTSWRDLNPRFGYALQLNHKTVMRGGYGIFFLPRSVQGSGAGAIGTTVTTQLPFDTAMPTNTILDPFASGVNQPSNSRSPISQVGSTMSIPTHDFKAAYVQMFTLDIQRQIPWSILLDVYYWANLGTHIPTQSNLNQLPDQYLPRGNTASTLSTQVPNPFYGIIPNQTATISQRQSLLPFPQYLGDNGIVQVLQPVGKTNYNALTAMAQKRLSNTLSFTAQYTWGKAMDNLNTPLDTYNRAAEYAESTLDVTNQFVSSFIAQLPYGRGRRFGAKSGKWVNGTLGGWNVNGIITVQSGFPVMLSRPVVLNAGANPHLNHPTPQEWFNTSVISPVGSAQALRVNPNFNAFSFGNIGPNLPHVRSDGIRNLNAVVEKTFKNELRGHQLTTQVRAESYNVLNHPQFATPIGTYSSVNFGTVTSQLNTPRYFQFGIKVKF
jgi:hypothetical protein